MPKARTVRSEASSRTKKIGPASHIILLHAMLATALGTLAFYAAPAQAVKAGAAVDNPQVAKMFHPVGPLPSYEVATIKPADPSAKQGGGPVYIPDETIRSYILGAYAGSTRSQQLIVGGPAWISTDKYVIHGKPPEDLQAAMQKMTQTERNDQERMMEQSLLAERFHLKAHFEMREVPIIELAAVKKGLKIKPLMPIDPTVATDISSAATKSAINSTITTGTNHVPAGVMLMYFKPGGVEVIQGDTQMSYIAGMIQRTPEAGGRPVVDKTGVTEKFHIDDLEWKAGPSSDPATAGGNDAPPLFTALEENLGIKVTATRGQVEVLVIDSIDRPTDN
jgi:uncharacterized protein (TIGR03435 family)